MNVPIEPKSDKEYIFHYNVAAGIAAFVYWFRKDYGGPVWLMKHHGANRRERRAYAASVRRATRKATRKRKRTCSEN